MTHGGDEGDKDLAKRVEGAPSHEDPWRALTALTPARLGLGRVGAATRTATHLGFQADHAFARDAVHAPFSAELFASSLTRAIGHPAIAVTSRAGDRATYLRRPESGRRLSDAGLERLRAHVGHRPVAARPVDSVHIPPRMAPVPASMAPDFVVDFEGGREVREAGVVREAGEVGEATEVDVAILVCDGLSSIGIERHGPALVGALVEGLSAAGLLVGPIAVAAQGRVALGDEVGEALGAKLVIVLIGERPGLSAADSVGLYLTFAPRRGRTDAERNCISNVHPPDGLGYQAAAHKAVWLTRAALTRGETGVHLKDESEGLTLVHRVDGGERLVARTSTEETKPH